MVKGKRL